MKHRFEDFTAPLNAEQAAYQRARRQVRAMRGFFIHAAIYTIVISGLCMVNLIKSPSKIWFPYPAFGWGLGLLLHGFSVRGRPIWFGQAWEEKKIRTLSTEKQLAEAQLRLLQAQIEPHFLFNTLANVVSLIEPAPAKAQLMLENFIHYLRGSLAASRTINGTFSQEKKLLTKYLELLKIRMGERLHYSIDIDERILDEPLAPMLLQPLVENAIKHGLEPKVEGGSIQLVARKLNKGIEITVEDNGLGFQPKGDSGIGLENLRQRLEVLYDGKASLNITDRKPGTAVTIQIPSS
jgi:sensor histidine kinase YesM